MREETGYKAANWTALASFWASPGYVAEKMTVFLATGLTEGKQEAMEDERIEIGWYPVADVGRMIRDGEIIDAKTIVGYFMYREHQNRD